MKEVRSFVVRAVLSVVAATIGVSTSVSQAEIQSSQVVIQAVQGDVTYSTADSWQPLKQTTTITRGTLIKTGPEATVDLILKHSGTALRLIPNSTLGFDKLNKEAAGEQLITDTSLNLIAGSVIGSQRKLASPSTFQINVRGGVATIVGTEYLVRADGAVTVLSGSVTVTYNLPGNGGAVRVTVSAGFSFNPATGQVVTTTAAFLQNIIADVDSVRQNAQVFKAGGATVVITPDGVMSPTRGNNGLGNGIDPAPPGNPPLNDGPGSSPGTPGNGKGGKKKSSAPRTPK
jgi:hypothetical protein